MLFYYQAAVTLLLSLLLLNLVNNLRLLKKPPLEEPLPHPAPRVSVLVPARNEERNIGLCVGSLMRQDYPDMEVFVLDDNSTDETAAIVKGMAGGGKLTLLRGRPLPPGWHGKAYACHQLSLAAGGEWLLFTDADTIHQPQSVSSAIKAALREGVDLVSFLPRIITVSFWEKVILPIIPFGILAFLPLGMMNSRPDPRLAVAIGPFILVKRDVYRRAGGHQAIRDDIVDDIALARQVKKTGGRVMLMDGTEVVAVRFYRSLGEIWQGISKSAFAAMGNSLRIMALFVLLGWCLFVHPYYLVFQSLRCHEFLPLTFWLPSLHIVIAWFMHYRIARRFNFSLVAIIFNVVMVLAALLMVLNSARCTLLGKGVLWKGRYYDFRARRQA